MSVTNFTNTGHNFGYPLLTVIDILYETLTLYMVNFCAFFLIQHVNVHKNMSSQTAVLKLMSACALLAFLFFAERQNKMINYCSSI